MERFFDGSREPFVRAKPATSGSASWTVASPPSSMVTTRKIAAGVSGARTGCGCTGGILETLSDIRAASAAKMVNVSATAQGLCEFIDASPSPYHVCATAAARLQDAGYTELSE